MKYSIIEDRKARRLKKCIRYQYSYYLEYDYTLLSNILSRKKNGSRNDITYAEAYIMLDTETSKHHEPEYDSEHKMINQENHICMFTCSIRAFHMNFCTLRGTKPSEIMHMLNMIRKNIKADVIYIFVHNLAYDYQFLRRFLFDAFGKPINQLNVKNHYPITVQFENGIILRDSLILAGVSLEKWGENLNVEHKKAIGYWDYDVIRNQNYKYSHDELIYAEHDTLSGVECLNKLADQLGDTVVSLPFTNTGIVRRHIRKIGHDNYAKQDFNKQLITFNEYQILENVFHGGFTHSNRHLISWIIKNVIAYDFKSSYPYSLLVEKYPIESYFLMEGIYKPSDILKYIDTRSYIFKLIMVKPILKDKSYPMPSLQFYKCSSVINCIKDNGRILSADYVEIYLNEIDLKIIEDQYTYDEAYCVEVRSALKDYLPKWFRDEVFNIFREKCKLEYQIKVLKSGDMSMYNIKKAQLNSLYGMCVTKAIKDDIKECYDDQDDMLSGEYYIEPSDMNKKFDKYNSSPKQILPYVWGVYCTSYAMMHLFELSNCIIDVNHHWIYSDTDSIYSDNWDHEKVREYNKHVKDKLLNAGYGSVIVNNKEYWLGIAELDTAKPYDQFITLGAKRYATCNGTDVKITVAGVPKKKGAKCLRSLDEFKEGFIFSGEATGKQTHSYIYSDIHTDDQGNECADSIDLTPADYTLSSIETMSFEDLFLEEVTYDWFEES